MSSIPTDNASARLLSHHLQELEASTISPAVRDARGYTSITNPRALPSIFTRKQRTMHGLLIPIRDVTGDVVSYQLKPDNSRVDASGRTVKYETASGGRSCIDVPVSVLPLLRNADVPLWITEGCKKVDSGLSNGIACIVGLTGVENWQSQGMALPDWKEIALRGRRVIIAFDSDAMTKASVRGALERFGSWLGMQQADVRYLIMPALPDGSKCGLDDWFVTGGSL
jgi:hypothetical protein